jgi:hypothetical protein
VAKYKSKKKKKKRKKEERRNRGLREGPVPRIE